MSNFSYEMLLKEELENPKRLTNQEFAKQLCK